ncbi:lanthionine synthetase C family protein [Actinokineospora sp. NBRC 105648]|uniref:lanthionine synthetase C family protein n=1 Tax=Actinokineospora sp. NBRC 105648 TaxID=3032206 RepID=UPI0024A4B215|nr:lanthionine synthetase C family protein [Actinokineospora sp. NBRC 105648]GLZ42645.1 hypothetical protein Acsp05_62690 [Actinokineospora sp. NBRC 105648]
MSTLDELASAADTIAQDLLDPATSQTTGPPGSLANGAAGIALLHAERAEDCDWAPAHAWLTRAVESGVDSGDAAALFHGAPAVAFVAHGATGLGGYQRALTVLDAAVTDITHQRLGAAHARLDRGERPAAAEFDLLRGLTGLGAHHLRRHPDHRVTTDVLEYLVRLTHPLDGRPGWWTDHGPNGQPPERYPGGHGNFGMAHGVCGPLALLALAARAGVVVAGQYDAIHRICSWLDRWRQDGETGHHWPETIGAREHDTGRQHRAGPHRPSWCYGTPGLARAQQLAALATGDSARKRLAETALLDCLGDPAQQAQITEPGLCHGVAGLLHTTWRTAADADSPELTRALAVRLSTVPSTLLTRQSVPELLDGGPGVALALRSRTGWDRCLLVG